MQAKADAVTLPDEIPELIFECAILTKFHVITGARFLHDIA
jgi:hypothetical protein